MGKRLNLNNYRERIRMIKSDSIRCIKFKEIFNSERKTQISYLRELSKYLMINNYH